MSLTFRHKRVFRILLVGVLGLLLVLLAFPVWLPWLFRPIARKNGLNYGEYKREGYSRFLLAGVNYTNSGVSLKADVVEALLAPAWLWNRRHGVSDASTVFARVSGWELRVNPTDGGTASTHSNLQQVLRLAGTLKEWLPRAQLESGRLVIQSVAMPLPNVTWSNGVLRAEAIVPKLANTVDLVADFRPAAPSILFNLDKHEVHGTVKVSVAANGSEVTGTAYFQTNHIQFEAGLQPGDVLPSTATLRADSFSLPGHSFGLEGFETLRGSFAANWISNHFTVHLHAAANPSAGFEYYPPAVVDLSAHGDTQAAMIERLDLAVPWLKATLSRDLTLHYSGPLVREPVGLSISADLGKQNFVPLTGTVSGGVQLLPGNGTNRLPTFDFSLAGFRVGTPVMQLASATAAGRLVYPTVTITEGTATFLEGGSAKVTGTYDLKQRCIADAKLAFVGQLPSARVPNGLTYENLEVVGSVSGPLTNLVHSGHLEARGLRWTADRIGTNLHPLAVKLDWQAQHMVVTNFEAKVSNTNASLVVAGAVLAQKYGGDRMSDAAATGTLSALAITLNRLRLSTNSVPVLSLEEPATVSVQLTNPWLTELTPLRLSGTEGRLQLKGEIAWPGRGQLEASMEGVRSSLATPWISSGVPGLTLQQLATGLRWTNGPVHGNVAIRASATPPAAGGKWNFGQREITLSLGAELTAAGISVSNLALSAEASPALAAHGSLPIVFVPGGTNFVELLMEDPFRFDARTDPASVVWNELARRTGVTLVQPHLQATFAGTPAVPRGELKISTAAIQFQDATTNLPSLKDVNLAVQFNRDQAELTQARLEVQGQPVLLTGTLPLGSPFWSALRQKRAPPLDGASGHILLKNAQISSFSTIFPRLVSPEGEFSLDLKLLPNRNLGGELRLDGAALRPLPDLGALRDIHLKSTFTNRTALIEQAGGDLGGARVLIGGSVDLSSFKWSGEYLPPARLTLRGTNVPITRQPDLILRADVDLLVVKTNGAPPLVTGSANMRNGLFMRDLRDFVPGKVAKTPPRAPYFSIEEPALAPWRLDVRVSGQESIKVRTPIFNGTASPNLHLVGTLKEPVALGDVHVDSGSVRFPFANLPVTRGYASVTSQDPTRPRLSVTATTKQFGYDITMQASGPADAPVIQFNSSPPLSSERILLMITAGQMPGPDRIYTTRQRAQSFAVFLGRDLLSKYGIGDQSEQRLMVQTGEQISEAGKPTYLVEYRLSENWSLVGEYDRFSEFNAGVKWRIYSK